MALEIAMIGGGRLAEVMARLLSAAKGDIRVRHWARNPEVREKFGERYPSFSRHDSVQDATKNARIVVLAVPTHALEEVATRYGEVATADQVVLHACRGAGPGFVLPHKVIRGVTCARKIVTLGGPLHGRDLGSGRSLAAAVASRFPQAIDAVRAMTAGTPVKLHPTQDIVGVEVAGAMSNVWALASGMSDALELGDTARGLLLTRGLVEAQRVGLALGADAATFAGIAGLGELIPRKVSSMERHQEAGAELARGKSLAGSILEGVTTAHAAVELSNKRRLKLPLLRAVASTLENPATARAALESVLALDLDDLVLPRPAVR